MHNTRKKYKNNLLMKIHVRLVKLKFIMVVTKQQKMVAYTYTHLCDSVIPQILTH
jgi:hypothetical protein